MSGDYYLTEVEITVNHDDDGDLAVCFDLGGELHVFDLASVKLLREKIDRIIEFAEDYVENGPMCEHDA